VLSCVPADIEQKIEANGRIRRSPRADPSDGHREGGEFRSRNTRRWFIASACVWTLDEARIGVNARQTNVLPFAKEFAYDAMGRRRHH